MDGGQIAGHVTYIGSHLSRRRALQRGGLGLGAALLGAGGFEARAGVDDGTPAAVGDAGFTYLFVQTGFASGTLEAKPDAPDAYTLTLMNAPDQTAFFSDRPERIVGVVPTELFVEGLILSEDDPPNAALVIQVSPTEQEIIVLELVAAGYDAAAKTLTYETKVLEALDQLPATGAGFLEPPLTSDGIRQEFGASSLFVDSIGKSPWDPRC